MLVSLNSVPRLYYVQFRMQVKKFRLIRAATPTTMHHVPRTSIGANVCDHLLARPRPMPANFMEGTLERSI